MPVRLACTLVWPPSAHLDRSAQKMKALFWIFVFLTVSSAVTVVTGYKSYSFSSSGVSVAEATATERILTVFLIPLFAYVAFLVKKGGVHAWWVVTVLWISICLGFLTNILHGFDDDIGFLVWMLVSQIACASLAFYYWFTWWLPKKASYQNERQNQTLQHNAGSRPPMNDLPASDTPSSPAPRG
jgi:hypothetical protein